jgi:hypothetical protein
LKLSARARRAIANHHRLSARVIAATGGSYRFFSRPVTVS